MRLLSAFLVILFCYPDAVFARVMDDYPAVQLRALDKIPARTLTFDASVGSTVRFGSLYIKVQACRKAPPVEAPESAAFLQIWETEQAENVAAPESEWVYSGWMFASSPALSAMDHAIYDVWVMDCLSEAKDAVKADTGTVIEGEGLVADDTLPEIDVESLPAVAE